MAVTIKNKIYRIFKRKEGSRKESKREQREVIMITLSLTSKPKHAKITHVT